MLAIYIYIYIYIAGTTLAGTAALTWLTNLQALQCIQLSTLPFLSPLQSLTEQVITGLIQHDWVGVVGEVGGALVDGRAGTGKAAGVTRSIPLGPVRNFGESL